jgi:hypothetical protein
MLALPLDAQIGLLVDYPQLQTPRPLVFEYVGILGHILVTKTLAHALPDLVFDLGFEFGCQFFLLANGTIAQLLG